MIVDEITKLSSVADRWKSAKRCHEHMTSKEGVTVVFNCNAIVFDEEGYNELKDVVWRYMNRIELDLQQKLEEVARCSSFT